MFVSTPFLMDRRKSVKRLNIMFAAAAAVALSVGSIAPAKAQNNQKSAGASAAVRPANSQIQMPPPEAMIIMIRSSLVALSQANVTNNYQVLNALGSENFRASNSPARLAQIFAPFRTNNIDLAPVVFVTPQLSQQPQIKDGKLRMIGFFPTQPMRVDYDLQFEPSGGTWKLLGISVNLNAATPQAQGQPQPQTKQPQSR
jgi:hypothetical protein